MNVIGHAGFCDCVSGSLPIDVDFQRYVSVAMEREQSQTQTGIVNAVLSTRNSCVAAAFGEARGLGAVTFKVAHYQARGPVGLSRRSRMPGRLQAPEESRRTTNPARVPTVCFGRPRLRGTAVQSSLESHEAALRVLKGSELFRLARTHRLKTNTVPRADVAPRDTRARAGAASGQEERLLSRPQHPRPQAQHNWPPDSVRAGGSGRCPSGCRVSTSPRFVGCRGTGFWMSPWNTTRLLAPDAIWQVCLQAHVELRRDAGCGVLPLRRRLAGGDVHHGRGQRDGVGAGFISSRKPHFPSHFMTMVRSIL